MGDSIVNPGNIGDPRKRHSLSPDWRFKTSEQLFPRKDSAVVTPCCITVTRLHTDHPYGAADRPEPAHR